MGPIKSSLLIMESLLLALLTLAILYASPPVHAINTSGGGSGIPIVPADVADFINDVRSSAANSADIANMNKIEWDGDLRRMAQQELNCGRYSKSPHNTDPVSEVEDGYLIEFFVESDHSLRDTFVQRVLTKWSDQSSDYDLSSYSCSGSCDHYYQMVWAESCTVGCAAKACPRGNVLICKFSPLADYTPGTYPYRLGTVPCEDCSNSCENYLCTESCDGMGGGGDPHFSVHLPSGQLFCFTVQGEVGMNFNLISTKELEMNAQFVQVSDHPNNTWLGAIGITVAGKVIIFNSTSGDISIENKLNFDPSLVQKVSINDQQLFLEMTKDGMKRNNRIEVEIKQINLQFTVVFVKRKKTESKHLDMLWKSGGIDTETVHGLLGQFLRSGIMIDEDKQLLILPGRPAVPVVHQKLFAFMQEEGPQYKGKSCWTAKKRSNQGVGVIEGTYIDYEVNSLLHTGFTFGVANSTEI